MNLFIPNVVQVWVNFYFFQIIHGIKKILIDNDWFSQDLNCEIT